MPDAEPAPDRAADLALLAAAAREAGEIALRFFGNAPKMWTKGAGSPVTEADIAADRALHASLTGARPDYGWLSEETTDSAERLQRRRVFIVDPIDGTRGFIEGNRDWCVSVAVVEDGAPIAGVLFVPAREELFEAMAGAGARLNGAPLRIDEPEPGAALRFAGPMRHMRALARVGFEIAERRVTPSLAYRLALVAAGRLELATAGANAHDWDLAAADLLVHEAGGMLLGPDGAGIAYNRAVPRHPALLAGAPKAASAAFAAIAEDEAAASARASAIRP